jgi:serine phosphatase RsbU (regulator of sigma subunit)
MEQDSPRFVLRTLLFHGLLLAGVLALVSAASVEIYTSTRDDALLQAKIRQELLADQTCRGIETFYTSIIRALGWIQTRQEFSIAPAAAEGRTSDVTFRLEGGARPLAAQLIAEQLGDRISAMFVYNQRTGVITTIAPEKSTLTAAQLSNEMRDWLQGVNHTKVSRFMKLNGQGVSLVAAPFTNVSLPPLPAATRPSLRTLPSRMPPRLLVAVIPGEEIESNFLPLLNEQNNASATLVDGQLQVITSSNRALEGMNLADFDNADLRNMILAYHAHPKAETGIFPETLSVFGVTMGPRIVTLSPVIVAQDQWTLFFAYPLSNIDVAINALFKRAVFWAIFVAASVTAIVVSTAVQMIRYRARLERLRHQVLKRELSQARRIQEQWLPSLSTVPPQMDVAAINEPASHISGDFYNWFELPDGRQTVVIGDVTGHGMAAAFLMATTQLLVRGTMNRLADPGLAMWEVNTQLCSQMFVGQFVTMLILTLDFQKMQMEVASAGHPPPLIGKDGKMHALEIEAQLVLGVEKRVHYPTQRMALPELSNLLLYTDGILDARGPADERFGARRLVASLAGHSSGAQDMITAVTASVQEFAQGRELEDDLTLVAIQLRKVRPPRGRAAASLIPARRDS